MKQIVFLIIYPALLYLAFAFVIWEINPRNWNEEYRACFCLLIAAFFVFRLIFFDSKLFNVKPR